MLPPRIRARQFCQNLNTNQLSQLAILGKRCMVGFLCINTFSLIPVRKRDFCHVSFLTSMPSSTLNYILLGNTAQPIQIDKKVEVNCPDSNSESINCAQLASITTQQEIKDIQVCATKQCTSGIYIICSFRYFHLINLRHP